jgi:N-dimethylarginine dimethylaminohydrolase
MRLRDAVTEQNPTRRYLMCAPEHFTVEYSINPWMHPDRPTDTARALAQWRRLHDLLRDLGHQVDTVEAVAGLPDMVFAANAATVVDGRALLARFRHPVRAGEQPLYEKWLREQGLTVFTGEAVNEGEGDLLTAGGRILAGHGFRTEPAAHAEAAAALGREVVALRLVDPRFYHLDTALSVLRVPDEGPADVMYWPGAFDAESRDTLAALYPDALRATEADAAAFGLNALSDGRNVVLSPAAGRLVAAVAERGYTTHPVDLSELLKSGGGAKCCVLEVRS